MGDTEIYVPKYDEAQARMSAGSDVYLYRFDHYNDAIFPSNLTTKAMKGKQTFSLTRLKICAFKFNEIPNYKSQNASMKLAFNFCIFHYNL